MVENDTNPGEQLQKLLEEIYPLEPQDNSTEQNSFFVFNLDFAFKAEGNFSKLVYQSSINYLVRRLIYTAAYIKKKYQSDNYPPEKFVNELRRFIQEETRIEYNNTEKIIILLQQCLEARNKKRKSSSKKVQKKRIVTNTINQCGELRCYICGQSLSETEMEEQDTIQIEHFWPQALGGRTQDFNLKVSCLYCNNNKKSHIDYSDFHYEQICIINHKNDINCSDELARKYKIAIWAKNGYSCSVCGKKASEIGKLGFGRINLNDSWHFLNIESYCDLHNPEQSQ